MPTPDVNELFTGRDLDRLADDLRGEVVAPDHPDYHSARAVWNASINRHPAAVVRCRGVEDVRRGLEFAVEGGLPVAVRGGGHNVAGFGTCDAGIVLDLGEMSTVEVDPDNRRAVAGPGTLGGGFDEATQAHGLATTLGVVSTTGIAGLTLGGGIGWLQRTCGLTCDNLVAAQVLTAGGELVRASEQANPELLWGLKGGGGNFGIVTSFTYRLHPVGPELLCGLVAWPAEQTTEVLGRFREVMADADDELMIVAVCRTAPAVPFLPEEVHGRSIIALAVCWVGGLEGGRRALAPLRTFGEPVGDIIAVRPYTAFQQLVDASWTPGFHNYWKAEYLEGLTDELIEVLARYATAHSSPLSDFKVVAMGGAVARVGEHETACPHRSAPFVFNINTRWADPTESDRHIDHTRRLFEEASAAASAGGTYVNFLGDEGTDRVEHAYGRETFTRLQALKEQWDPDNVFRLNQNIPPPSS